MAIRVTNMGVRSTTAMQWHGRGVIGGNAPDPLVVDAPDGRFKKMNVPASGRVTVSERVSMMPVRSTISAADGTWRIGGLREDVFYVVMGFDDTGQRNAAIQDWVKPHVPEP